MPITVTKRKFIFDDETLADPDPNMTPSEVISFYSAKHPELIAGTIKEQETTDDGITYTIGYGVGTKA